jgi:serine/threonine-protein kinase
LSADRVGKYRLLRLLASGGMGEVFLARQEGPAGFAKPAVVKRILTHLAREQSFVEMFLNEARLAALLTHPNCIQIFELGEDAGTYFIAMEFIHGRTLRGINQKLRAKGRTFPPAQLARICAQALMGLHYAHTLRGEAGEPLNIVHRDMSPDNIMVGFNGTVKVLDFGIAKAAGALSTTRTGTVKGKFAYMSPEQLNVISLDGRADQWSLGVLLYELLAGARPYVAPVEAALVNLILNSEPVPLKERVPAVPAGMVTIVEKAMKKNRDERFASAEEMAIALEKFAAAEGVSLTNGETQSFMREVFGDEANENPAVLTPSGELPLLPVDVTLGTATATPYTGTGAPGRSRAPFIVFGLAAVVATAVGLGYMTTRAPVDTPAVPQHAAVTVDAGAKSAEEPNTAAVPVVDAGAASPVLVEPTGAADAGHGVKAVAAAAASAPKGTGKVDLRVTPWAEIFEGKKSLGVTPMPPIELSVGTHQLTLKNSDLNVSRNLTVKVTKGGTVLQRVDLSQ